MIDEAHSITILGCMVICPLEDNVKEMVLEVTCGGSIVSDVGQSKRQL